MRDLLRATTPGSWRLAANVIFAFWFFVVCCFHLMETIEVYLNSIPAYLDTRCKACRRIPYNVLVSIRVK